MFFHLFEVTRYFCIIFDTIKYWSRFRAMTASCPILLTVLFLFSFVILNWLVLFLDSLINLFRGSSNSFLNLRIFYNSFRENFEGFDSFYTFWIPHDVLVYRSLNISYKLWGKIVNGLRVVSKMDSHRYLYRE